MITWFAVNVPLAYEIRPPIEVVSTSVQQGEQKGPAGFLQVA